MAYGVYSDRGYREHILERNKNTNKTEVFTQEDQSFTGRKTFLSGVTTSDLEVQTVEVSESLKVKGKDITEIIDYFPNDVSKENKLTTEDFVNSSISTNTANFLGTFNTLEEIEALTDATNNDYAFWKTTDTLGSVVFKRYKYIADEQLWKFEYDLNNSSFTSVQWDAINSGITEELVSQIGQGGSALVPSITQEQYNNLTEEEKNNGQIREITNTNPKKVMLNGMDLNVQLDNEPIGAVILFPSDILPQGWLGFDGTVYNKSDYPRLWNVIPNSWKISEEQFRLPNLKGRVPQGADNNIGELIEAGLPNLIGQVGVCGQAPYSDGKLFATIPGQKAMSGINYTEVYSRFEFNANKYNSIYGNSGTVQPNAIAFNYIIKATNYTQATEDILYDNKVTTGNVLSAAKVVEMNSYSTEETVIGKWIDGKPIYRKVININPRDLYNWGNIPETDNLSILSIKKIINATAMGTDGSFTDCVISLYARREPNKKFDFVAYGWHIIATTIILEYTKTTD